MSISFINIDGPDGSKKLNPKDPKVAITTGKKLEQPSSDNVNYGTVGSDFDPIKPVVELPEPFSFPEKKEPKKLDDIEDLKAQIKRIQEALDVKEKESKKQEEEKKKPKEKPVKPIETLKVQYAETFFALAMLDFVEDPLRYGVEGKNNYQVRVASKEWFRNYWEMIANGWPLNGNLGLKDWLKRSAKVFEKQLGIKVIENEGKDDEVNHVYEAALWYPQFDRQKERFQAGNNRLLSDIRLQSSSVNPFLPGNIKELSSGKTKEVCAPRQFDFVLNGEVYKDFLRNWTYYNPDNVTIELFGKTGVRQTVECSPQPGFEESWVPLEYREKIYAAYDMTEFKYLDDFEFQTLLYNVAGPITTEDSPRDIDSEGHTFITIKIGSKSYKVYYAEIQMNYPLCADSKDKGITLAEWCDINNNDPELLPLYYVLLNLEPPKNEGMPGMPGILKDFIYTQESRKGKVTRMWADAPLSAFQMQAMKTYGVDLDKNPTISHEECLDIFIRNIYEVCRSVPFADWPRLEDEEPTEKYINILTKLFEYGGHRGCSVADAMNKAKTSGILSPQTAMTKPATYVDKKTVLNAPKIVQQTYKEGLLKFYDSKVRPFITGV